MHGYKKPKNEWAKKKSKRNKFNDYEDEFEFERKKDKKNKRYHRIVDGYIEEEQQ